MRFCSGLISSLLLSVRIVEAASSWNFDEAIISVTSQGRSDRKFRDKLSDHAVLANPVTLSQNEKLKIIVSVTEDGVARRPHQAFLLLRDQENGLEASFPFSVKENGKGVVELTHKELPVQFDHSSKPLRATLLLASFGDSLPFSNHVFNLEIQKDPKSLRNYENPLRYGKQKEITHTFKADPKGGSVVISALFVLAVVATVPMLITIWLQLGANLSHLPKALASAPIAHILFYGSVLAIEGVFFLYYKNWTLFQVLPAAGICGLITILSGPKALSEVQSRRLAGER